MRVLIALAMAVCLVTASSARAQSDDDRAAAMAMMQAGVASAQDGDWEAARVAFTRAYALVASTRVLMNLAGAQRHTGRLLEARASYEQWLHDATDRDEPYRADVEQALTDLATEIPRVRVRVEGGEPTDTVELDGEAIEVAVQIQTNPGEHVFTLRRGASSIVVERVEVASGEDRDVTLAVPSLDAAPEATTTPTSSIFVRHDEEAASSEISPWVWVGVGVGAAVLVAVIIGVAVAASSGGSSPMPDMGTFGPFHL